MPPRWIEKDATKAQRLAEAKKAAHDSWVTRHASEKPLRKAFEADMIETHKRAATGRPVPLRPGTRALPPVSDDQMAVLLSGADAEAPRHLAYPEVMVSRERGLTRAVWGDDPRFPVPVFKGDVLTEAGAAWLAELG